MITLSDMSLEDMQQAEADGYRCVVCGGRMSVAWINGWVLRCGNDVNHTGITRHDLKREKMIRSSLSMNSTELTTMSETAMIARVGMAKFPKDLTPNEIRLLAQAAISYGFDPIMGEISIFQGKPYISIDGRYRAAQETGLLDGVATRPANKQEREDWQIPDGDYFFRAEVKVKGMAWPMVGWGRVRKAEVGNGQGFQPVQNNPQRMAEKRAEAQALRKAFHIPLPSLEEIGTPEDNPEPISVKVNVVEPEKKALPETNPVELAKDVPNCVNEPIVETKPAKTLASTRNLDSIKTIKDMVDAVKKDFGMTPTQAMKENNVESWNELTCSPREAYQKIAAVRI